MAEVKAPVKLINPLYKVKESNVNQIGETNIKFLDGYKLKKGEKIKFRLLKKKPHPDPKKKGQFIYPNTTIRTQFWIDDKENGPTEIAAVQSVNRDNTYRIKKFSVDGSAGEIFILYGDLVEDLRIFPYLMLSPENKTSPFYDKTKDALFEVIDELNEAKKNVNRVGILQRCLTAISNMEDDDLKLYNSAFGGSVIDEKEVMINRLNELAIKDPVDFLKKVDEPIIKIKSLVKQATELNIIQHDPQQHRYIWVTSQETIATLDRVDNKDPIDLFSDWLNTVKEGGQIQKMIKQMIK